MQKAASIFKIIISICCLLFFVLPIGRSFEVWESEADMSPEDMANFNWPEPRWGDSYFYYDEFLILAIAPLFLLWLIYLILGSTKQKLWRIVFSFLLVLVSCIHCWVGFLLFTSIMQDFRIHIGVLLLFIPAPLLCILLVLEIKSSDTVVHQTIQEDILLDE